MDDVRRLSEQLPEVTAGERRGNLTWFVRSRAFAWDRPFTKADLARFGSDPVPDGPIVAVLVADLEDKEALLAGAPRGVFTIPHFDGYRAVLVQVRRVSTRVLSELLVDAWLAAAPATLARAYSAAPDAPPR